MAGPFDLSGRRALVTGGSRGIGRAIALALAESGADVAVTSRNGHDGDATAAAVSAKGRRSMSLLLEVRHAPSIRVCFERLDREWGSLDILVNNAGTNRPAPFLEVREEDWDEIVDTDLKGVAFVSQAAATRMVAGGRGGRIVSLASTWSAVGREGRTAYSAAKGGLVAMTRTLALELAPHGITVNAVGPSLVETELTRAVIDTPEKRAELLAKTPLGRFATPEDIAAAVVYFASPGAAFVTGQALYVDGGWTAQ